MSEKIILDVDPGHDDAVAILLAGQSSKIDLRGITTVAGNQILAKTLKNALKICEFAGLEEIPVFGGRKEPLIREQVIAPHIHGETGLDGCQLPEPSLKAQNQSAVDFIIEEAFTLEGDLVLVPTGPLTNIAAALKKCPELEEQIKEIIFMGGSCGRGNVTPAAEFNIYADPEAASIVLNSAVPTTMVGLNLTSQAQAKSKYITKISALDNRVSKLVVDLLDYLTETCQREVGDKAPALHDVCTVAKVIDPEVFTTKKLRVDVELAGEYTYGRTVCDQRGVTDRPPNVKVSQKLDKERFWGLLINNLAQYN